MNSYKILVEYRQSVVARYRHEPRHFLLRDHQHFVDVFLDRLHSLFKHAVIHELDEVLLEVVRGLRLHLGI